MSSAKRILQAFNSLNANQEKFSGTLDINDQSNILTTQIYKNLAKCHKYASALSCKNPEVSAPEYFVLFYVCLKIETWWVLQSTIWQRNSAYCMQQATPEINQIPVEWRERTVIICFYWEWINSEIHRWNSKWRKGLERETFFWG